ncbi:hypothetical protein UFOVP1596_56 [uncultured Caudovirales phage]|uniref:Uncharacterized protein n=1 Tax=uncultured Caudovirales phage TaxID=2100421 RepID=A0A6J5SWD8_9CAUD|nr:hypothetical protein UFOVP1596_56 [uncultured Caudovirales phage]
MKRKTNFSPIRFIYSLFMILLICMAVYKVSDAGNAAGMGISLLLIGALMGQVKKEMKGAAFVFIINDTTYAGEAASAFIVKAITGADTVDSGSVYIKDGIKKKFTIPRWDANYEDFIQDRKATPTPKGDMTIDGQSIDPADYMIYAEFNPRDFEDHWEATQLNPELIDAALPYSAESVVVQGILARHAKYFNKQIWNGDSTLAAPSIYRYFDGYINKANNSGSTIKVSSPVTLTVGNIQGELLRGYQAIPAELRYDPNMKFFMSYATYDLYMQSQINQTYKGVDTTSEGSPYFKGRKCVKIADFPDDAYLISKGSATPDSNLWVGMNSIADEGLKLAPVQANSELWFIKMLMKVDVNFGWFEEAVLYY